MTNLMPPGWTAHQDPQGRWYYHHMPSGTTQWTPPPPQSTASPQPTYYPPPPQQSYSHPSQSHPSQSHPSQSHYQQAPSQSGGRYVYNHPVEFKLKEKYFSLSGDNFSIKDVATGQPTFNVKGNAFSFKDSKSLFDVNGNAIYKMTESILSLRGRMQITDSNTKQPVLTLRKKGFIPMLGTSTIQAWRGPTDDGEPDLVCKGDVFRKDFNIKDSRTGATVATVKRKSFTLSNILLEKDTYIIRVEPGIDAALMVFLVIAIDEQYRDDGSRKGYGSFF